MNRAQGDGRMKNIQQAMPKVYQDILLYRNCKDDDDDDDKAAKCKMKSKWFF